MRFLLSPEKTVIDVKVALQDIVRLQVHHPGHPSACWARDLLARSHVLILNTETTGFDESAEVIDIALMESAGKIHLNRVVQCQEDIPPEAT